MFSTNIFRTCGWIWKINLIILWKHVIKNLQVKHRQYDSIIFSSEGFTQLLGLCLADSRILYCWNVLESIHKFIIELHVLQCLFVRGFDKRQKSGRIASNFTKRENFASFMTTKCSWGLFYNVASLLALFRLAKKSRTYSFILKIARMFPILTTRVGIVWWTLL